MQGIYLAASLATVVFSATLVLSDSSSAQSVKDGIDAWQRSEHAQAVAIWRPLAENGDPDAAFNLGQAYRLGRGVPRDLVAAKMWLDRAASKGHVNAQTTLGLLLYQNGDYAAAARWLMAAAEQGEPRAMLAYGTALFNGQGVTQDRARARDFVRRAAAQGLQAANDALAEMDRLVPQEADRLAPQEETHANAAVAGEVDNGRLRPSLAGSPVSSPAGRSPTRKLPPRPADQIRPSGEWRVQLGAFAQRASAQALFKHLVASNSLLADKQLYLEPVGKLTRLQVGPFRSQFAASQACAALSTKGQPCMPVVGK